MALIPYALARSFLFSLDPETAHELTLHALSLTQGNPLQLAYCSRRVNDPITLAGLTFPNRVGLAAGLDKNGQPQAAPVSLAAGTGLDQPLRV